MNKSVHDREVPLATSTRRGDESVPKPRTIVVSDVRLYREGLALALTAEPEIRVVGTAATFDTACTLVEQNAVAVVLLDAGMHNALDFARELLRAEPSVRVVGVAVNDAAADIVACAEAGLAGYVPRDGSIADTVSAIIDATQDELRCSPRIASELFRQLSHPLHPPVEPATTPLTPRELDVVRLVDRGLSNKEIAQRLSISTATVKNHVHNLLEKLNVGCRADAAAQLRSQQAPRRSPSARRGVNFSADLWG